MKRFLSFVILLLSIYSCNDGNVAVQDISFENTVGDNYANLSYKIKGNEVLIIKYADINKAYIADQTAKDLPIKLVIDANNPVTYRVYNGVPTAANFNGTQVPPATPIVVEEWIATSGTIEITTTIAKTTDATTNATTITGYNNYVQLKNITFKKPNGDQFYETFNFGNITVPFSKLNFAFNQQPIDQCSTSKILTSKIGVVALISFDNNSNLIQDVATPAGSPRTATIDLLNNKLFYRVFTGLDPTSYICKNIFLPTDSLTQEWKATTGTVEVITTQSGLLYTHKVYLKGVKFVKGTSDFYLGDTFFLGTKQT